MSNLRIKSEQILRDNISELSALGGLIFCLVIFTLIPPIFGENIWSPEKLSALMSDVIVIALIAVGAVFTYALGNLDISIGKQVGLYASIMVLLGNITGSLFPGILLSVILAIVMALNNGTVGEYLKIHPIVPSLVVRMVLTGVSSMMYTKIGSRNINLKTVDYSLFKNPWFMLGTLIVVTGIVFYLFNYTKFGKNAKAIGANKSASEQCGINIVRYRAIAYIILSLCVVIASMFQMGYTGSASDSTGTGFELNVIVVLVLGGMPLSGGMRSKISRAIIGAFTFSLLDIGLPLIGIPTNWIFLVKTLIFLVVVLITSREKAGILPR